jgi:integrase
MRWAGVFAAEVQQRLWKIGKRIARQQVARQTDAIDAAIAAGTRGMLLRDAFDKYRAATAADRAEALWLSEWIVGSDDGRVIGQLPPAILVGDVAQSHITDLRIARAAMTTNRIGGYDAKGQAVYKLVSVATVNRMLSFLRAAIYYARDHYEATINPRLKFNLQKEEAVKRHATEDEEAALIDAVREDYHPILAFSLMTGIRKTGVCTLEWRNVFPKEKRIRYQVKRHRGGGGALRWDEKILTAAEMALVESQRGHHPHYVFTYVATGHGNEGEAGDKGKRYPITAANLDSRWRRDRAKAAEVCPSLLHLDTRFRWHDLRHTFATRLLQSCGNMALVGAELGHQPGSTVTAKNYAHVQADAQLAAREAAQGALAGEKLRGLLRGRPNLKAVG